MELFAKKVMQKFRWRLLLEWIFVYGKGRCGRFAMKKGLVSSNFPSIMCREGGFLAASTGGKSFLLKIVRLDSFQI